MTEEEISMGAEEFMEYGETLRQSDSELLKRFEMVRRRLLTNLTEEVLHEQTMLDLQAAVLLSFAMLGKTTATEDELKETASDIIDRIEKYIEE